MHHYLLIVVALLLSSCHDPKSAPITRHLGDTVFDPTVDRADFNLCYGEDNIYQYFNLGGNLEIEGDKPHIIDTFNKLYKTELAAKQSGLVRIRFVVNCQGESDRFRLLTSDLDYQTMKLDKSITDQLMTITKSLTGWKQKFDQDHAADYYQYLIFRIVDGQIRNITP